MAEPKGKPSLRNIDLQVLTKVIFILTSLACFIDGQVLQPPYLNLAERKTVWASSTCGVDGNVPEMYCRLTGVTPITHDNLVIQPHIEIQAGQFCEYCDSTSKGESHPADYAVDGTENWWQSPPLSRGIEYNKVNFTVELGQEFQVSYIWIKMANSPRPAVWILERSTDFGKTWSPWQYFTGSDSECREYFRIPSSESPRRDDEAICTTKFSDVVPLEDGEIIVSLVDDRPSSLNFSSSLDLQEWTKATNVRLQFMQTNTLLGHLMAVKRQDVTVTRRYFYSIRDISIGGRCVCNGHAERCDTKDQKNPDIHYCRCEHNTCGRQCEKCCPGFEQKRWRPLKTNELFTCEPCNCHNHSSRCIYDAEVDRKRLSLDIHGRYSGGGVCQDCQHFTEGINCEKCRRGHYRDSRVSITSKHACKRCQCRGQFSTGDCDPNTGQCLCKRKYTGRNCDRCNIGYHSFPECKPCECNQIGTENRVCQIPRGNRGQKQCPCKPNYTGIYCDSCQQGYFGFPDCKRCVCNRIGSRGSHCDKDSGRCHCHPGFAGLSCNQCAVGYFDVHNNCRLCNCDVNGCTREVCDRKYGRCICKPNFSGARCDQCRTGYYQFPQCYECGCSQVGSRDSNCRNNGQCMCKRNFAGRQCSQCAPGFYRFPDCIPCNCSDSGSEGQTCNQATGRCLCRRNFQGFKCDQCKRNYYKYPQCIVCDCNPAGAVQVAGQPLGDCGLTNERRCRCKARVTGEKCNMCKQGFWGLDIQHKEGCAECQCSSAGTTGGFNDCDWRSGQCLCKPSVTGRMCSACLRGTYNLQRNNPFGCDACNCNIGGSINIGCQHNIGQCNCKPGIEGVKCDRPQRGFYFPTLHQHKYEFEDGSQYGGGKAIFAFNEGDFPEFSWRGYAIMSSKQRELLVNVMVRRPILCRIIIRYFNKQRQTVHGTVSVINNEQKIDIMYRPSNKPELTKLSDFAIPFVLNPGQWALSFKADQEILLDYFVLIPQQYYEPTVLQHQVSRQCRIPMDNEPCQHYQYPSLENYPTVKAEDMSVIASTLPKPLQHLSNATILNEFGIPKLLLMHSELQSTLSFSARVNNYADYYLIINYFNPTEGRQHPTLSVTSSDNQVGEVKPYYCPYSSMCRQVVTNYRDKKPTVFRIPRFLDFLITGKDVHIYVESVALIPAEAWTTRFLQPRLKCVRVNKVCRTVKHQTVSGSIKIEAESGVNSHHRTNELPDGIKDISAGLVKLDEKMPSIDVAGVVRTPDKNHIVVHYYQPKYPGFPVTVNVHSPEYAYSGSFYADYCPSDTGCRAVVKLGDSGKSEVNFPNNEARIKFTVTKPSKMWLDYVLLIPGYLHRPAEQDLPTVDMAEEFLKKCTDDVLSYKPSPTCSKQLFALTTDYNNGTLPCKCDPDGSMSIDCESLGGQCRCLPNVIGRDCSTCKHGFYGFPSCKRCECSVGLCHPVTGDCVCPPHVTGRKCDRCLPNTYAYDPYIGCKQCGCNARGVMNNNLNCDQNTGQCKCLNRFGGRTCDKCAPGSYSYPHCVPCACNATGAEDDVCDQDSGQCLCKKNVEKSRCRDCLSGSFHLERNNPNGCTTCFCFGVISSCSKSNLRWSQVSTLRNWNIQNTNGVNIIASSHIRAKVNERVSIPSEAIYWSAPSAYLGNKIPSYGGRLSYKIVFSSKSDGVETVGPDVILVGNNMSLAYYSKNPPENNRRQEFIVDLREYTFMHEIHGTPVRRDQFMMVLAHLEGIYIKASYLSKVLEIRLSNVQLEVATKNGNGNLAHTVEKCHCPASYRGTSCEKCASGHYRRRKSPFFGLCSPCECNGHTKKCDPTTGECLDCQDNTTGFYCEKCKPGYSGDPANGVCAICACPMPVASNNFAKNCVTNSRGDTSFCSCREGYRGAKCDKCSPGYYGDPLKIGGSCQPCQCSDNIDLNNPNSCDKKTGECRNCTNNSAGKNCNICKEGWFGDPVMAKNCTRCTCDTCGTSKCDDTFGFCYCKPNVVGKKCNRCLPNHYGFKDCNGCKSCDCGLASRSDSCDDMTGQCRCEPGAGGRKCDRCLDGYWDYGPNGCKRCSCARTGVSRTCDPVTGVCRCMEGYVGSSCNRCAKDWVKVPGKGCSQCDKCTKLLLSDLGDLHNNITSVRHQLQFLSVGIEAQKELAKIKKDYKNLREKVNKLPSKRYKNYDDEIDDLNQKAFSSLFRAKRLNGSVTSLFEDGKKLKKLAKLPEMKGLMTDIINMINYIKQINIGKKQETLEELLDKAHELKTAINNRNFIKPRQKSEKELDEANETMRKVNRLKQPVINEQKKLNRTKEKINDMEKRLMAIAKDIKDSKVNSVTALRMLKAIEHSKELEFEDQLKKNISEIEKLQDMTRDNLTKTEDVVDDIKKKNKMLPKLLSRLDAAIDRLRFDVANEYDNKIKPVKDLVEKALNHSDSLVDAFDLIQKQYFTFKNQSDPSLVAATAYKKIVDSINEAQKAAKNALNKSTIAQKELKGVSKAAEKSKDVSEKNLKQAKNVDKSLKSWENALDDVKRKVDQVEKGNEDIKDKLASIKIKPSGLKKKADAISNQADKTSDTSNKLSNKADDIIDEMKKYKDLEKVNLQKIKQQIDASLSQTNVKVKVNDIISKVVNMSSQVNSLKSKSDKAAVDLKHLRKQIELARSAANAIIVSLKMFPNTTLQLRSPSVPGSYSNNKIQMFINPVSDNGLLAYIGNPFEPAPLNEDFLALELVNNYVVMKYNLGSGITTVKNQLFVQPNVWHYIEAKRTGSSVELLVSNGNKSEVATDKSNSAFSLLELNPETTHFYIGGYPFNMNNRIPSSVTRNRYHGAIEGFTFNDYILGLWNFAFGENNFAGFRNRKVSATTVNDGYRFDGRSYAKLKVQPTFSSRFAISMEFKTSKPNGLLMLMYHNSATDFASLHLEDGHLVYQYELGSGRLVLRTNNTFNDGKWHSVKVSRRKQQGLIKCDSVLYTGNSPGTMNKLSVNEFYVGGYTVLPPKNVSDYGFVGCIRNLQIDLISEGFKEKEELYQMSAGCPSLIAQSVRFPPFGNDYVFKSYQMQMLGFVFHLILKFRVGLQKSNSILVHASIDGGTQTFTVFLKDGKITVMDINKGQVTSNTSINNSYSDDKWHYITILFRKKHLKLNIDDKEEMKIKQSNQKLNKMDLYIGGVPSNIIKNKQIPQKSFNGCIEDVIINGELFDFNQAQLSTGVQLNFCKQNIPKPTNLTPIDIPSYNSTHCALPEVPEKSLSISGQRFGTTGSLSWWHFEIPHQSKVSNFITLEFNTRKEDGLLLYASDKNHNDFLAVYLEKEYVVFAFNCGGGTSRQQSTLKANDGHWHTLSIKLEKKEAALQVDREPLIRFTGKGKSKELNVQKEIYVGGIQPQPKKFIDNVNISSHQFIGCMRNLKMNKKLISENNFGKKQSVKPCYDKDEEGVFIGANGGHIKLLDRFYVGTDLTVAFEMKPRTINGVLFAVHAVKEYLVIGLKDGNIYATANNEGNEFTAKINSQRNMTICNGKWYTVEMEKYKHFLTLSVSNFPRKEVFGKQGISETKTNDPLYIGGIPNPGVITLGVQSVKPYIGCIKNLMINSKKYQLYSGTPSGDVQLGSCPKI
ncbi:laminin subunit alpha-like [Octopus vulgaris]|uniref:Laminin subunit alpha-like n=1 Tax=Octopus vulgaris TaxID=6645 RepID=A0AA36B5A9_OCTVU|nr:laminin subunit alpha-like [Octopus vulgaris]